MVNLQASNVLLSGSLLGDDGQRFLMIRPEDADQREARLQEFHGRKVSIVLNWFEELKRKLSQLVGASAPRRIDLDCEVNASASFRRGFVSMLGNDLVLTIGLPLVAGLDLRQLSGVLAHEFGHFAQGGGMRLSYIIRRVNHWFARVVFERDEWDASLKGLSDDTHHWMVQVVGCLSQGCVWLTRRLLWVLMMLGNAISCFLLRQMEFDADRYEARVAGSAAFESTALKLQGLGLAARCAQHDLGEFSSAARLPDDFPKLVQENYRAFSPSSSRSPIPSSTRKAWFRVAASWGYGCRMRTMWFPLQGLLGKSARKSIISIPGSWLTWLSLLSRRKRRWAWNRCPIRLTLMGRSKRFATLAESEVLRRRTGNPLSLSQNKRPATCNLRPRCSRYLPRTFFDMCMATNMWGTSTTAPIFRSPAREQRT